MPGRGYRIVVEGRLAPGDAGRLAPTSVAVADGNTVLSGTVPAVGLASVVLRVLELDLTIVKVETDAPDHG